MKTSSPIGYSGMPLCKKLGINEARRVVLVNAPEDYERLLEPLPPAVEFVEQPDSEVDLVQIFAVDRDELLKQLIQLRRKLKSDAALWVSWPKKASKVATNVTENTIRELALPLGFVDIKVCAVTQVWSGLKLVVRKELR